MNNVRRTTTALAVAALLWSGSSTVADAAPALLQIVESSSPLYTPDDGAPQGDIYPGLNITLDVTVDGGKAAFVFTNSSGAPLISEPVDPNTGPEVAEIYFETGLSAYLLSEFSTTNGTGGVDLNPPTSPPAPPGVSPPGPAWAGNLFEYDRARTNNDGIGPSEFSTQ